jgi:pimeloyl-ACP methyl ester carboxylesterase
MGGVGVIAAAALVAVACGKGSKPEGAAEEKAGPATEKPEAPPVAPATDVVSQDVTIEMGSRSFGGTLTWRRTGGGATGPGVLLIAGSGPTDRDWNSPALPGTNGSGKLIAEELARRGMLVLRYDKTTSKKNPPPPDMTYDLFRDEARAALARLRIESDSNRFFIAGHSEGGIQALRVAQAEPAGSLAGVILLSSAGRRIADVMLGQLEQQFADAVRIKAMSAAEAEKELGPLRAGFADFTAGKEVDPMKMSSIPAIQQMLMPIMSPAAARVGRPWVMFDPAVAVAEIAPPVLILNGDKDAQVDPELDARRLEKARREAGKPVELVIVKDANHVYKLETRSMAEIRANLAAATNLSYAREGIGLAPGLIDAVAGWIAKQ